MKLDKNRKKTPVDSLFENQVYTLLREAREEILLHSKGANKSEIIERYMQLLVDSSAKIPTPLKNVEFRLLKGSDNRCGDVALYFRVQGSSSIFNQMSGKYKLQGTLGTEGRSQAYIHYREGFFSNATNLSDMFYTDIETLRRFLNEVDSLLDFYRFELRSGLNSLLTDLRTDRANKESLEDSLEQLGFRPKS